MKCNKANSDCSFLVVCYPTLHPTLSVHPSVRWLVGWSITFYFFTFLRFLHHSNAWLAFFITVPAHQHATWVAVYPALLQTKLHNRNSDLNLFHGIYSHKKVSFPPFTYCLSLKSVNRSIRLSFCVSLLLPSVSFRYFTFFFFSTVGITFHTFAFACAPKLHW